MPGTASGAGVENSQQRHEASSTGVQLQIGTSSLETAAMQISIPLRVESRKTTATWKDGYEITDSSCCSGGCHISHYTSLLFTGTLAGLNGLRTG